MKIEHKLTHPLTVSTCLNPYSNGMKIELIDANGMPQTITS